MKSKFTKLMAAFTLLVFMTPSLVAWGQQQTTATISNFTAISGNIDNSISYAAYKGNGTTAPLVSSGTLRIYKPASGYSDGGYITITAASGCELNSVTITNSDDKAGTIKYSVDGGTLSSAITLAKEASHTVNNLTATSISFYNCGGDRLSIAGFSVTYTSSGTPQPQTYTVTYAAGDHGTGTMTDSNSPYTAGATVTLLANTFTPDNGYQWDAWEVKDASDNTVTVNNGTFSMPASNVTVTAQWTQTGGGSGSGDQWVETTLAQLTSSDVFVIVGNNGSNYAMSNNNGTSNPPAAVAVTVSGNKLTGTIADNIKWNISGNATDGYTFYPNGSTTTWLYCTNTNNGVRVGTNNGKTFKIDSQTGYLKHDGTSRYVGIYSSQDWRCYTSAGGNIANQTFTFYKKVTTTPSITIPASIALGNVLLGQQIQKTFTVSQANLTAGITLSASVGTLSTNSIAQGDPATQVTWTYTPATAGAISATITATSGTLSETLSITGTAVTQMTVAAALAATAPQNGVYVHGYISQIDEVEINQYHNATYWISDDGTTTGQMKVYHGKYLNNDPFTATDQIGVGDEVVVTGNITEYQNANQLASGNYIVSLTPHQAQQYTLAVTSVSNATIDVFDATDPDETNWVSLFVDVDDAQVTEGTPIALSVSADQEGYGISSLMVDGVEHVADIDGGLYTFNMPNHNVNITVTAIPVYNITYSENGVETQAEVASTTLTLPTAEDLDSEFSFAGWTTTPGNFVTPTAAGTQVTIQGGETFYAVYARTEGREAYYEKVTEDLQDWSGNYLIVAVGTYANEEEYSVAFDGSLVDQGLDASQNSFDVEIESGRIAWDDYNSIAYFTIAPIEVNNEVTGWSIQSASGYYVGRTANSNGMNISDETAYSHTLSIDENDNAVITSGSTVLRFNKNSGQERFRYYTGSGQQPIQLFKEVVVSQGTPVYYTRVFIWETAEDDITITGPSIIPSGSTLDMDGNTLTNNLGAANLVIEDGAQVICGNAFAGTMLKDIIAYPDVNGNAGYYIFASPIEGFVPTAANGFLTQDYDLYAYNAQGDGQGNEWINLENNNGFAGFDAYHGYLYASGQNTTLQFAGILNDSGMNEGFAEVELYYGTQPIECFTLVGNSLASQVTYETVDPVNFLVLNEDGDQFVIESEGANEITLDPMEAVLVYSTTAENYFYEPGFFGSVSPTSQSSNVNVKISRVNGNLLDNAIMSFTGSMMKKLYLSDHSTRVYFPISNEDYAVVPAQLEGEQPVNFKANENGTYVLSVEVNNLEMNYLHLIDNMTGADVDLLATPSYTFEAKTTDYASRFRLVFSAEENGASTGSATFAFFNGSEWTISNIGEATLQVVDVMGRILSTETVNGNATINVNQPTGVYMLRLINGDNVRVQKVVVR